jgi:hypothetical protein
MKPVSTIPPTPAVAASAFQSVMQMSTAFWLSRSVHVVAELGIADAVDLKTGTSVSGLAIATKTNEQALARILRFLSSVDVFALECGDSGVIYVEHTPASLLLRSDNPQSLRPFARMIGSPISWASFGKLEHSLRTGNPSVPEVSGDGQGIFDWFVTHPEEARVFDEAMAAKSHGQIAGILGAYDFSPFACIADVGGGNGHLLAAILAKTPTSRGILIDLPHVVARATERDRLTRKGTDFFTDPLPAADLYILMEVIHDWNDRDATRIFEAVRRAAPPTAKVLIIEHIVEAEQQTSDWAKALDINMLTLTGGLERTRAEYDRLLASTGFRLDRVITTTSPIFVMEASAA